MLSLYTLEVALFSFQDELDSQPKYKKVTNIVFIKRLTDALVLVLRKKVAPYLMLQLFGRSFAFVDFCQTAGCCSQVQKKKARPEIAVDQTLCEYQCDLNVANI